jgi:ABC-type dipeptide/oligopeptide/nickel transport system ATPase component
MADVPDPSPSDATGQPILEVENLRIAFRRYGDDPMEAVRGIDLSLQKGESLAIVGESGSGKSATVLSLARLLPEPPAEVHASTLKVAGHDILSMSERELRKVRGRDIAYVFQEPTTSLNPVLTVRSQIGEALELHRPEIRERDAEIIHWLDRVGIVDPEKRLNAYPHELSGGMQQRVMIAMALSCEPSLLIADEPTTALDVTIQKQIMDLLVELRHRLNMSLILITHNLGIIRGVADKVAVMFRGQIVETGPVDEILRSPQHPYTQALLDCVPRMGAGLDRLRTIDYDAVEQAL